MKAIKLKLVLMSLFFTGCAGMNGPCGPFAKNGTFALSKSGVYANKCQVSYTMTNNSDGIFKPIVVTRVLDKQGNTLGQDTIYFDMIDPGRSQKKAGLHYDCSELSVVQVLGNAYYPGGQSICGVSGKTYRW